MISISHLAFVLLSYLPLILAAHIAALPILNRGLELQADHAAADINKIVSLNDSKIAFIVPTDLGILAEGIQMATKRAQNTPASWNIGEVGAVANSYASFTAALTSLLGSLFGAKDIMCGFGQETSIYGNLSQVYGDYETYSDALYRVVVSDYDARTVIEDNTTCFLGEIFSVMEDYDGGS